MVWGGGGIGELVIRGIIHVVTTTSLQVMLTTLPLCTNVLMNEHLYMHVNF